MTEERKELIAKMQKVIDCNPRKEIFAAMLANVAEDYKAQNQAKNNDALDPVSNPLPTKEEVIEEGDKQIEDWLSENHYKEQRAYRVAFRRSYEYVLRFIK